MMGELTSDEAARRIARVRVSYLDDLDKLKLKIASGGEVRAMKAAVDAYYTLAAIERELAAATVRINERASDAV